MRRSLSTFLTFVLLAILASCDGSTPTTNDGQNSDDDSLRVISVTGDSLYGGEQLMICMSNGDLDTSKLQIYVHSTEFSIDSLKGACLYLTVPRGATSGLLRVYYDDTVISNDRNLTLFAMHIQDAVNSFTLLTPREGPIGTVLTITTTFVPHRPGDLSVRLGSVELPIIEKTQTYIRCSVIDPARDSDVVVRVFHRERSLGLFDVRTEDERFLDDRNVTKLYVSCMMRMKYLVEPATPPKIILNPGFKHSISSFGYIDRDDSIRVTWSNGSLSDPRGFRIALTENGAEKTVSGTIAVQTTDGLQGRAGILEHQFTLRDVPYTKADGKYKLGLLGPQLKDRLVGFESVFFDETENAVWTLIEHNFEIGTNELTFEISVR